MASEIVLPFGTVASGGQFIVPYGGSLTQSPSYNAAATPGATAPTIPATPQAVNVNVELTGVEELARTLAPWGQAVEQIGSTAETAQTGLKGVMDFTASLRRLDWLGLGLAGLGIVITFIAVWQLVSPAAEQGVKVTGDAAEKIAAALAVATAIPGVPPPP